jgi:hypothetical protein
MYLPTPFSRDDTIIWTSVMLGLEIVTVIVLQCCIVYNLVYPTGSKKTITPGSQIKTSSRLFSLSIYDNPFIEKTHGL